MASEYGDILKDSAVFTESPSVLAASLKGIGCYERLDDAARQELLALYPNQLAEDFLTQCRIIRTNICERTGVSNELRAIGKGAIRELVTASRSPSLLPGVFPLEELIWRNWQMQSPTGVATMPQLLDHAANDLIRSWTHTPSQPRGQSATQESTYARANAHRHPIWRAYSDSLASVLFGQRAEEVNASNDARLLLLQSGGSCLLDTISALESMRYKILHEEYARGFRVIALGGAIPYVEAGVAVDHIATRFPEALVHGGLSSLPYSLRQFGISLNVLGNSPGEYSHDIPMICREAGLHFFYIENIGNNKNMTVADIGAIARALENSKQHVYPGVRKVFVYIDTSLMGGLYNPLQEFRRHTYTIPINFIVGESLIKYTGYGTDRANLGLWYGKGPDIPELFGVIRQQQMRRGEPSIHSVASMPLADAKVLDIRRNRFGFNAHFLAQALDGRFGKQITVVHPSLEDHPDHAVAQRLYGEYAGSVIYLKFSRSVDYPRIIEKLLAYGDDMVGVGTSYGLNSTRVEVRYGTINGEKIPVGLRISVGTENIRRLFLVLDRLENVFETALAD